MGSTPVIVVSLLLITSLSALLDPARQVRNDSILRKFEKENSPGCALDIVRNGAIVYAREQPITLQADRKERGVS